MYENLTPLYLVAFDCTALHSMPSPLSRTAAHCHDSLHCTHARAAARTRTCAGATHTRMQCQLSRQCATVRRSSREVAA